MKNKTNCKDKCCFDCEKSNILAATPCQYKCGEVTNNNCIGVMYNDCPNFVRKQGEKESIMSK
jgi:hypothetical protein